MPLVEKLKVVYIFSGFWILGPFQMQNQSTRRPKSPSNQSLPSPSAEETVPGGAQQNR